MPPLAQTLAALRESAAAAAHTDAERSAALLAIDQWAGVCAACHGSSDRSCQDCALAVAQPVSKAAGGSPVKLLPSDAASLLHESLRAHADAVCPSEADPRAKGRADQHSWLRQWWSTDAYLSFRAPLPLNVSYWFLFTGPRVPSAAPTAAGKRGADAALPVTWSGVPASGPRPGTADSSQTPAPAAIVGVWQASSPRRRQCLRSAAAVCAWLEQRDSLRAGRFPVEVKPRARPNKTPNNQDGTLGKAAPSPPGPHGTPAELTEGRLCPLGWESLFHACRRPALDCDVVDRRWTELVRSPARSPDSDGTPHADALTDPRWVNDVVVMRRGTVWTVTVPLRCNSSAGVSMEGPACQTQRSRYDVGALARELESVMLAADAIAGCTSAEDGAASGAGTGAGAGAGGPTAPPPAAGDVTSDAGALAAHRAELLRRGWGLGAATGQPRGRWAAQAGVFALPGGEGVADVLDAVTTAALALCLDPRDPSGRAGADACQPSPASAAHSEEQPRREAGSPLSAGIDGDRASRRRDAASALLLHSDVPAGAASDVSSLTASVASGAADRWFDKPIQLVAMAGPDAPLGLVAEHSDVDGMPVAALSEGACAREGALLAEALAGQLPPGTECGGGGGGAAAGVAAAATTKGEPLPAAHPSGAAATSASGAPCADGPAPRAGAAGAASAGVSSRRRLLLPLVHKQLPGPGRTSASEAALRHGGSPEPGRGAGIGVSMLSDTLGAATLGGVASLASLGARHACSSVVVSDFGADAVKKRCRVAPDAFAQCVFQLAWAIAHLAAGTPNGCGAADSGGATEDGNREHHSETAAATSPPDDEDDSEGAAALAASLARFRDLASRAWRPHGLHPASVATAASGVTQTGGKERDSSNTRAGASRCRGWAESAPCHPRCWAIPSRDPDEPLTSMERLGAGGSGGEQPVPVPFPLAGQYEPAHTRSFRGGRTACIRGLSGQTRRWVAAALAAVADEGDALDWAGWIVHGQQSLGASPRPAAGGSRTAAAIEALREAAAAHRARTLAAMRGQDADRHVFGMRRLLGQALSSPRASGLAWPRDRTVRTAPGMPCPAEPAGMPWPAPPGDAKALLTSSESRAARDSLHPAPAQLLDAAQGTVAVPRAAALTRAALGKPAVERSGRWRISTSNLGSRFMENWGWGQVVPDGVGVAYSLHAGRIQFNVVGRSASPLLLDGAGGGGSHAQWTKAMRTLRQAFEAQCEADPPSLAQAFAFAVPIAARLAVRLADAAPKASAPRESKL